MNELGGQVIQFPHPTLLVFKKYIFFRVPYMEQYISTSETISWRCVPVGFFQIEEST